MTSLRRIIRGVHRPGTGAKRTQRESEAMRTRAAGASSFEVHPVGVVHNEVRDFRTEGWEQVGSRIEIDPAYGDGIAGLDGFSHVLVVTWLHLAATETRRALTFKPRVASTLGDIGVFALRLAVRPNPIGISVASLVSLHGLVIEVCGLDALDGTPVLDLKPYLPAHDCVPDARLPDWARQAYSGETAGLLKHTH